MKQLLLSLLAIESPTTQEKACYDFAKHWLHSHLSITAQHEIGNNGIFQLQQTPNKPHLAFVGHLDVVPKHFPPIENNDQIHGSGASDMKGGVAAFLHFIHTHQENLIKHYNISIILYACEENTPVEDNGLHHLLQKYPEPLKSIDLAIVAEPTNNTIQIGCVGSLHASVTITGKAAHSARPWDGENALYNAIPFISKIAAIPPKKHSLFGVEFFDVLQITESHSEPGKTTLPGYWKANINFRFAPTYTLDEAKTAFHTHMKQAGLNPTQYQITDAVYAGAVIETDLFKKITQQLDAPIQAKQAWTDVAQLTAHGISAFNFGPGLTAQAHHPNEYIQFSHMQHYIQMLEKLIKIKT